MEEKSNSPQTQDNIGIVSMECYFPKSYISQSEFEQFNNVSAGKYTIGLGQKEMAFTNDREDICSISLTVLSNLINKNKISYSDIGWVCVATETIIDHSKSVSSMLMDAFHQNGNTEIEGIDVKHACYAGTFALFTAFERITSKYWDGKYCVVIAADIAEYAQGPARCTGGCGAVALLLGKDGCIDLNVLRSTYKAHEYDFYKPHLNSPYPVVNGHVSNSCYLNALDACFVRYKDQSPKDWRPIGHSTSPDYWIFHAPYNKLVSKTFGRVVYHDFINNPQLYYTKYKDDKAMMDFLRKYEKIGYRETVNTREVIKGFEKISKPYYPQYVATSTFIPQSVGNCYTASIFLGLISLIYETRNDLAELQGKEIQMFSYGSGTMASLYSLKVNKGNDALSKLKEIARNNNIEERFAQRKKVSCDEFTKIMNDKEAVYHGDGIMNMDFVPQSAVNRDSFYANTYYLSKMDAKKQRFYERFEYKTEMKKEMIVGIMSEHDVHRNIARLKWDNDSKRFTLPDIVDYIGDKVSSSTRELLKKAEDHGLSKKGAIKIDKMINTVEDVTTACI